LESRHIQEWVSGELLCFQSADGQNLFLKSVTEKGLIGFAAEKRAGSGPRRGRKLMRPLGELSRNVTFWDGAGGPERRVLWQAFRPPGDGLFGYGVCISVLAVVLRAMAHQC